MLCFLCFVRCAARRELLPNTAASTRLSQVNDHLTQPNSTDSKMAAKITVHWCVAGQAEAFRGRKKLISYLLAYRLEDSRAQRILWLLEEVRLPLFPFVSASGSHCLLSCSLGSTMKVRGAGTSPHCVPTDPGRLLSQSSATRAIRRRCLRRRSSRTFTLSERCVNGATRPSVPEERPYLSRLVRPISVPFAHYLLTRSHPSSPSSRTARP